jgi:hypothetical protein
MTNKADLGFRRIGKAVLIGGLLLASTVVLAEPIIKPYFASKLPPMNVIPGDLSTDTNGGSAPVSNASSRYVFGFEGVSQYDGASFGRNFIPPDTMGAVGRTQYLQTSNGAYAVFDKSTGARTQLVSDIAFWAAAGQTGASGDSRVMYNAAADRWVVASFGANVKDLQIAISDTSNALGTWKSVKFEGYAGLGFGGTADYPTLALDRNAVYIGTNNFAPATSGGTNSFRGTTMNVIPLDSLFGAGAPSVANMKQFVTPFTGGAGDVDRGFAQQGVNSSGAGSSGTVLAASLFNFDNLAFKVNGLTSSSALGGSLGAVTLLGEADFTSPGPGRQPSVAIPANQRIIATLDERISSSVYEVGGRIYGLHTVNSTADGLDEARIRYFVLDAATLAILDEGDIGDAGYDYYQGSIAVNEYGQVVIGYNRSGLDPATGKIGFYARTFDTDSNGDLIASSAELFLHESLTDDYHNGSLFGQAAVGRQRWGDYSQVSVDPTNHHNFYLIGQFAREYNLPQFGHPGGTGGSRWGTWIAVVTTVPEPASLALVLLALGVMGGASVRQRRSRALPV